MTPDQAREFVANNHRAVLITRRSTGGLQTSPVTVGIDSDGKVVISSRQTAYKVRNLRRHPTATLCVFTDGFFGPWIQIEGATEIVPLPEAMEGLIDYYRRISGEHPGPITGGLWSTSSVCSSGCHSTTSAPPTPARAWFLAGERACIAYRRGRWSASHCERRGRDLAALAALGLECVLSSRVMRASEAARHWERGRDVASGGGLRRCQRLSQEGDGDSFGGSKPAAGQRDPGLRRSRRWGNGALGAGRDGCR
jgi:PPOX class probable F420-dependent enzyme